MRSTMSCRCKLFDCFLRRIPQKELFAVELMLEFVAVVVGLVCEPMGQHSSLSESCDSNVVAEEKGVKLGGQLGVLQRHLMRRIHQLCWAVNRCGPNQQMKSHRIDLKPLQTTSWVRQKPR